MIAPILKGEKVILKPMEPKHAQIRLKWYCDQKVGKYQDFGNPKIEKIRNNIIKRKKAKDYLGWMVFAENNELIGEIQLKEISEGNKSAKLAINIGETEFWNKGYATDGVKTVCKYFFEKLKYNRIELTVFAQNIGAIKCYEKCGFKKEGVGRKAYYKKGKYYDKFFMAIVRDDYKK